MTITSISTNSQSFAVETANAASARKPQPTTNNLANLVRIKADAGLTGLVQPTQAQQVQQLYRRGNTVPQIVYNLNLSAQAVDRYLNISKEKGGDTNRFAQAEEWPNYLTSDL